MKDFLVIYEDDGEGGDDSFVVDVSRRRRTALGALEVQHGITLGLQNTSSRLGKSGFITTIVGAVFALVSMILFGIGYPEAFLQNDGNIVRWVTGTALVGLLLLLSGVIMTHYGRRIKAHGAVNGLRVIEKQATGTTRFE